MLVSSDLDPAQAAAVEAVLTQRLMVITGPPGSGKTTTLRVALESLPPGTRVELAAPTGKAARRMAQATGRPARTLHRMLGWQGARGWGFNLERPVPADLVIVDESSMLDYELALALLNGTSRSRLVLVGDADQLPPIGLGSFFRDLIASERAPVCRLATQHRAAAGSWVIRNAPRVLDGGPLELTSSTWFECDSSEQVVEVVAEFAKVGAQVIAPMYSGTCGIDALNLRLAPKAERIPGVGHKVIQTRNDYDLDVMNGEIGYVVAVEGGAVQVRWPELEGRVTESPARDLELAYALSVHRVQGSEYESVAVVAHSSHSHMLDRTLLYTAMTRARVAVTLVGDAKGLNTALRSRGGSRLTGLTERLRGVLP
jgi:exodeoxyribonuclease V alpha subunit